MKITLYMDIGPSTVMEDVAAYTNPNHKSYGVIRYAVEVEIPDPKKPDTVLPLVKGEPACDQF